MVAGHVTPRLDTVHAQLPCSSAQINAEPGLQPAVGTLSYV
jgi:hypothetical protein